MALSMQISKGCAVFSVEGNRFYIPQISMNYVRPKWGTLGGNSMFQMFAEAEAELIDADTVKLSHSGWDGDLVLKVKDKFRVVESFGSGTFYSTFRGLKVKVFKSVMSGEWDTDDTHETW